MIARSTFKQSCYHPLRSCLNVKTLNAKKRNVKTLNAKKHPAARSFCPDIGCRFEDALKAL
jgi:hypothetical protein